MKRFLIGQYGGFDWQKYERDFKTGFYGIEACLFANEEAIRTLVQEARTKNFAIGVHYPLRAKQGMLRDALFMDLDEQTRQQAYAEITQELEYLRTVKPSYVLFHYPKPVILDNRVKWDRWRFADQRDYVYESDYPLEAFIEKSEELFSWLSKQSEAFHFTPVLEFDACNRYVYETTIVEDLLQKYPRIRLCLDTGRLYVQERIDPFFDARKVLKKFAKYAETIHLWTMQVQGEEMKHNHYPALPQCLPEEGWAPIESYLKIIRDENPHVKIVFEHRSELLRDEELERCYRWVEHILNGQEKSETILTP